MKKMTFIVMLCVCSCVAEQPQYDCSKISDERMFKLLEFTDSCMKVHLDKMSSGDCIENGQRLICEPITPVTQVKHDGIVVPIKNKDEEDVSVIESFKGENSVIEASKGKDTGVEREE